MAPWASCAFAGVAPLLAEDDFSVLPAGAVHLSGFLEGYIQSSIVHWSKGVVPYKALADFFRSGRPSVTLSGKPFELFATGEMWGKAVRSAALFYRYTGDPELKTILKATVADMLSTKRSNGTLSCSSIEKQPDGPGGDIWERKYVLLALDDYYTNVEPDPAVLLAMIDEADATLKQVGRGPGQVRIVDLGWSHNRIESSAILEPIMRLYKRTGYPRYLEFARYIVEDEGGALGHRIFDEVLAGNDPMDLGGVYPKAYEMTSLFEGLVEYYRATGNDTWKRAALQYFHKVIEHEITIIGNGGGDQPYHPNVLGEAWDNTAFEQTNPDIKRMMETCTGVTWIKFCSQVLKLTGDPLAADYIELYAYNGLIGAMKPEGDGFAYVNLLNGVKTNKEGWGTTIDGVYVTCCNLNGPEGLAYLPLITVMSDKDGAVVNLYNKGTASIPIKDDHGLHLKIETNYPLDGKVSIHVTPDGSTHTTSTIKLRIPVWSRQTRLNVNGQAISVTPGSYAAVTRPWMAGDVIELDLDMRTRVIKDKGGIFRSADSYLAYMRGPIVLARDENIDASFAEPVNVVADADGFVAATVVTPILATSKLQVNVPTTTGTITMVDYASVNSWQGKRVQTWLPRRLQT